MVIVLFRDEFTARCTAGSLVVPGEGGSLREPLYHCDTLEPPAYSKHCGLESKNKAAEEIEQHIAEYYASHAETAPLAEAGYDRQGARQRGDTGERRHGVYRALSRPFSDDLAR